MSELGRELQEHVRQSGLPLRRVATRADIPHQTLFNWINGVQPRWHPALAKDLERLACALELSAVETDRLLRLGGCLSARTMQHHTREQTMNRSARLPKFWIESGSHPDEYEMGIARNVEFEGRPSAFIRGAGESPHGFATLMQVFSAAKYRDQRVRLSAAVRPAAVQNWAGLWMRVDGRAGEILAFDNMQTRPINGSSEWERHDIVLDVAGAAERIAFGILLTGPGEVHIGGLRIDAVGEEVEPTSSSGVLDAPANLTFEE